MNIAWLLHQEIQRNTIDKDLLAKIGPTWGSWNTFNEYKTNNIICYDLKTTKELVNKKWQNKTNLYIGQNNFIAAGAPTDVYQFGGEFTNPAILYPETIIAANLAAPQYDILLLVGFDLSPIFEGVNELTKHNIMNYYMNIKTVIQDNQTCQFVLVDYRLELHDIFKDSSNLTADTVQSIKEQLL